MERGAWVPDDDLAAASVGLSGEYASLAGELGIGFADGGAWKVERTFDGVHFSEAGHRSFAQGLRAVLTENAD